MNSLIRGLIIFLIVGFNLDLTGEGSEKTEDYSLNISFSAQEIHLEDQLKIDLVLKHPSQFDVDVDKLTKNLLLNNAATPNPFFLLSKEVQRDSEKTSISYLLSPQIDGDFNLSFYQIPFVSDDANSEPAELFSDIFKIRVLKSKEAADFRGTPSDLLTFSPHVPIELSLSNKKALNSDYLRNAVRNEIIDREKTLPWEKLFLALIAVFAFLALKLFSKKTEELRPNYIQTAKNKAKASLDNLDMQNPDVYQDYYKQLSDILRSYIEDCYQIKALKKTTEEFLSTIQENPLPLEFPIKVLSQFLTLSDQVKFAKTKPSAEDCSAGYKIVREFIDQ